MERAEEEKGLQRRGKRAVCVSVLAALLAVAHSLGGQTPAPIPSGPAFPPKAAPRVGEPAPDFTLPDSSGKPVKLSELFALATANPGGKQEKGQWVLLLFYRGYW